MYYGSDVTRQNRPLKWLFGENVAADTVFAIGRLRLRDLCIKLTSQHILIIHQNDIYYVPTQNAVVNIVVSNQYS